jgi:hypothetical protein
MPRTSNGILIVGAPRSGTTWLAKIFDSHPDTLYRHEPDETRPPVGPIEAAIAAWACQRDPRTAGKRPIFRKSWQSMPARWLRTSLIYGNALSDRLGLPTWPVPDLGRAEIARLVVKSVRLSTGIGAFADAFPDGRALFILRHPCGQVASVMRGTRDQRFDLAQVGTDMPFDEASAIRYATNYGLSDPEFQALPDAAKYAWSWRAYNEPAVAAIAGKRNARVLIYEELCARPRAEIEAIFSFAGLRWSAATEAFLARSTHRHGATDYYGIERNSIAAAEAWRSTMTESDQKAVRTVVTDSPLIDFWPDARLA